MSLQLKIPAYYNIESANYITSINPMVHPDRILPYHDFLYIIEGEWEIIEEENVYSLHTDDLLILSAGRHHYGVKPSSANNRHMYIHAAEVNSAKNRIGAIGETAEAQKESAEALTVREDWEFHTLIHCRNNPKVKQLFEEIISAMWSDEELKDIRLQMLFGLFLCEIYKQQTNENKTNNNIVEQAVSLIQTTPQTFFTCTEMADRFFVCERTLNNLFRKTYDKTFYNYQMDRKLEMVRQYLLIHPDSRLDEAARNFGFCDESHLGKAYKKKYGVSPKRHAKVLYQADGQGKAMQKKTDSQTKI